jgi:hypothetical protein
MQQVIHDPPPPEAGIFGPLPSPEEEEENGVTVILILENIKRGSS